MITKAEYRKFPNDFWVGKKVVTLRQMRCENITIPEGAILTIVAKHNGFVLNGLSSRPGGKPRKNPGLGGALKLFKFNDVPAAVLDLVDRSQLDSGKKEDHADDLAVKGQGGLSRVQPKVVFSGPPASIFRASITTRRKNH